MSLLRVFAVMFSILSFAAAAGFLGFFGFTAIIYVLEKTE